MTVSTHVLDTSIGRPAMAVPVRLQRQNGAEWRDVSQGVTDQDGRVATLFPAGTPAEPGAYRLTFDVGAYFSARRIEAFYAGISIEFIVRDTGAHYHVPLLVSPYGYSTYRGT